MYIKKNIHLIIVVTVIVRFKKTGVNNYYLIMYYDLFISTFCGENGFYIV